MQSKTTHPQSRFVVVLVLVLAAAAFIVAGEKPIPYPKNAEGHLLNVREDNVMLDGHDPVAFFVEGSAVAGSSEHRATHQCAVYFLASRENRELFEEDPERYAPRFGGFCSMAVALGMVEPGSVEHFSIIDDRLYLQRNAKAARMWNKDVEGHLAKAEENWPKLVARAPGRAARSEGLECGAH